MRRFTAAAVAAATALSLAAAPAQAAVQSGDGLIALDLADKFVEQKRTGKQNFTPSVYGSFDKAVEHKLATGETKDLNALNSSLRNDAQNGYKYGTTFDILLGTGIAAVLLSGAAAVAYSQGLIKLPNF